MRFLWSGRPGLWATTRRYLESRNGGRVRRLLNHRRWLVLAGVVLAAAAAGGAFAAFPDTNVDTYTGCLNTGGTSGGQISQVTTGLSALKPCGSNQQLIHLSGGDITNVTAGSGLSGGGASGAVTLSLASGFTLPQSCAAGKIPQWDGSAWQCADDQTYTNGTGLDLSGKTFSLSSGYKLPQSCSAGQAATSNGDGTWSCHNSVGGLSDYTNHSGPYEIGGFDFSDTKYTYAWCNGSDIATGGGFYNDNTDIQVSDPAYSGGAEGWFVRAYTGAFASGHYEAYVKCLHIG